MKNRMKKTLSCGMMTLAVMAGSSVTAFAAEGNGQYGEEQKYVEDRLNNLTLGPSAGTFTFYPGTPDSGAVTVAPSGFTGQDLAAYADRIFELVNREREKVGVGLLERDSTLDEAAITRALDCASVNSLYVNGQGHIRPDGSRWFTVLGIDRNYNYGENAGQGGPTADIRMTSWMNSESHRANILRDDYTEAGIGCAVSEQGEIFAVQIFYRP